jgi:hypothetical protein
VRFLRGALALCAVLGPGLAAGPPAAVAGTSSSTTLLGITHTRESADGWNDPLAVARARRLIPRLASVQNQHVMGWGALNPEPSPGVFRWGSLDARVALMRRTGGTPVITLCCAPDWMKGGRAGATDWSRIERAPAREHFPDFAALARAVARRYPHVRHFQVWNELKGFHDRSRNRWDIEAYTELYNQVYDALKSVDPAIQVGGPYVPVDSWSRASGASHPSDVGGAWGVLDGRALDALDFWLAHKHGADFVTVDASTATKDRGLVTDPFTARRKLAAVNGWLRSRTTLPIWWAEWYAPAGAAAGAAKRAAVGAAAVLALAASGADVALAWGPQADGSACGACLWTDTAARDGGRPTPAGRVTARLRGALATGGTVTEEPTSTARLLAYRVGERCVLVNRTSAPVRGGCAAGGERGLRPYEVAVVPGR